MHARECRAHVWDVGVFGSVLMLLVIGLIALFSASYSNALFIKAAQPILSPVRVSMRRQVSLQ